MLRLALLAALTLSACTSSWDYVPVVQRDGGGLEEALDLATPEHLDRAEQVLATYGESTERVSPTALRVDGAAPDREFVWNVTTKAEDADWLREHSAP